MTKKEWYEKLAQTKASLVAEGHTLGRWTYFKAYDELRCQCSACGKSRVIWPMQRAAFEASGIGECTGRWTFRSHTGAEYYMPQGGNEIADFVKYLDDWITQGRLQESWFEREWQPRQVGDATFFTSRHSAVGYKSRARRDARGAIVEYIVTRG